MLERAQLLLFGPERYAQRINLARMATEIGEFWGLPSEIVERGKNTRLLVVNSQQMAQAILEDHRRSNEAVLANKDFITTFETAMRERLHVEFEKREYNLEEDVRTTEATFVLTGDNERVILVSQRGLLASQREHNPSRIKHVVTHELIHSMGFKSYLRGGILGFTRDGYLLEELNEGATELLGIAYEVGNKSIQSLDLKNLPYENFPYLSPMLLLRAVMCATHLPGGSPFDLQDLASYYFGTKGKDEEYINDLLLSLFAGLPYDVKESGGRILTNLCFPEAARRADNT